MSPTASSSATLTLGLGEPFADLAEPEPVSPWVRYEDLGLLGRGGMGEVRRVRDRILGRALAMKILAPDGLSARGLRARFLAEARLAAGLQHPGIVPVHDCGASPDGGLWFTMREVRGRTLGEVIRAAYGEAEGPSPSAFREMIDLFARVCEAVAHAHRHGVIHRDLKPENVMIGEPGEVLVVDWGLARGGAAGEDEVSEPAPAEPRFTRAGSVMGTPAYMPPEQARGLLDHIDRRSDVYALGAVLYEILCGAPPYAGSARAVLDAVILGPPPPVARRAPRAVPADLIAVCERAMARDAVDRLPDAEALAAEVRGFLAGERRRERALDLVREAQAAAPRLRDLRARARALRDEAAGVLGQLQTYDPVERKARGWAIEDEARALEVTAAVEQAALQIKLHAALAEAPEIDDAHQAIADLHAAELTAAEAARDELAAARAEALLAQHDRGRHAGLLAARGTLSFTTSPEGAEVFASRYVERGRRLVEGPIERLGRTPLHDVSLARGSYLLRVRAQGHEEMRYPIHLARGERLSVARPGDAALRPIPLLREGEIGPAEVYVPAGFFHAGGDPAAGESLPAQRIWVEGFILDRYPVTVSGYLLFLNELVAAGRGAEAEAACPCIPSSYAGEAKVPVFARDPAGRYLAPDEGSLLKPITSVTWYDALAYAAWRAARAGQPWRLPSEIEREKAARGADGRSLPWGDHPEPIWAAMVGSRPGVPTLVSIEEYETDESPWGARGLAGNVRDWCVEVWTPSGPPIQDGVLLITPAAPGDGEMRSVRGGAYYAPPQLCRAAVRLASPPGDRVAGVGLRLARPVLARAVTSSRPD